MTARAAGRQSQRPSSASSTRWYYIAALVALSGWAWSFRGRVRSPSISAASLALSCVSHKLALPRPLQWRWPKLGLSLSGTRVSSAQSLLLHMTWEVLFQDNYINFMLGALACGTRAVYAWSRQ